VVQKWLLAYRSAPPIVKAASAVSVLQLFGLLASTGLGLARDGFPALRTPAPLEWAGLALAGISLGMLFILPLGITASRYPRRRYKEALLFQGVLLFVFVDSFFSRPSIAGSVWIIAVSAAILLLLAPASRQYASERERRFAAADAA
jgi:hypothetical protein